MDTTRGFDDAMADDKVAGSDDGDAHVSIGTDERRMHVRAYNHWVSLLRGRAYPSIEDLDPAGIADFGSHSVLLDFSRGVEDPSITFLGRSLRSECALDPSVTRIADVPSRSLLSRLTDHYLQIIANRAPIGFEAEFVGTRGHPTLYRGILMPLSSDGDAIDYIYGVINWKELVDAGTQASLMAELQASLDAQGSTAPVTDTPVWADGPGADAPVIDDEPAAPIANDAPLASQLEAARESAAAARTADTRSRAALYRALGRTHDFAIAAFAEPSVYARLLIDAGIALQVRAPMTPLVKLIFGLDYDKTRVTEFASVLSAARAAKVGRGGLVAFIDAHPGGIKGVVQAARAARAAARPPAPARAAATRAASFALRPSLASLSLATPAVAGAPVLLVARAAAGGTVEIVGTVADEQLVRRAVASIN